MTVESNLQNIERTPAPVQETQPITVQNELNKEVAREAIGTGDLSIQKQLIQLLTSAQPLIQAQQIAKNQIEKGYLDVKV